MLESYRFSRNMKRSPDPLLPQRADAVAYAKLPAAIPAEAPMPIKSCADDDHVSTRLLKLDEHVSQPYVDAVAPTIKEQLAKAGLRLAMILNQIWP